MKKILFPLFLIFNLNVFSQKAPLALGFEFVCELKVKLNSLYISGETPHGMKRIISTMGSTVDGAKINEEILNSGADWHIVKKDGVAELEAYYRIKTDDGVTICIKNNDLRVATPEETRIGRGEQLSPSEYYFRAEPKSETPAGKYGWMNDAVFVCTGKRNSDNVSKKVWKLL